MSATVIRLWRNWCPSNGQQEHEKYKRNKMQANFRRDPPRHEACRINRISYVSSATATDTVLLGKTEAIPFITHPQILITSSLPQREVKTRLFGCPSPSSVTIPTELRRLLIVMVADFMPSCSVRSKRQKFAVLLLLFVTSYEFIN